MKRCITCCYPDTKPDLYFNEEGECTACVNAKKRPQIDWEARERALVDLLDRHHGEVIVPSSGGKDSTWQCLKLLQMGAHVTLVTATTCYPTEMGKDNISNLARYAGTVESTPNRTVRAKLNKLGLELVGDVSWPEHVAIFTIPFKIAASLGTKLIMYGECPQQQYGGPQDSEEAITMTRRWISEFGGFLGLRASDMVGHLGITERDMGPYEMPAPGNWPELDSVEAHFLGQYVEWDSHRNAKIAIEHGMRTGLPSFANVWHHENLDNAMTGLHDYFGFLKYGYGRGCAQQSVDIRSGRQTREAAMNWISKYDGKFPHVYAGVSLTEILDHISMTRKELQVIMDRYTNPDLFANKTLTRELQLREFLEPWAQK